MLDIYVDADACAVKDEIYRVALRYDLQVYLVSNSWMRSPDRGRVQLVEVGQGLDEADDWIAEQALDGDIVVTADIPLAARCLKNKARVLDAKGKEFSENSIGSALASREILATMREMGEITGGPKPMEKRDRSRFLGKLDTIIQAIRRRNS